MTTANHDFRLAIVMKDNDAIHAAGTLSFIDDVLQTKLADIDEPALQPTKYLLVGMVNLLAQADSDSRRMFGLELATFNKLESLAWKTYVQFIRKAYHEGSSLRAKHIRVD